MQNGEPAGTSTARISENKTPPAEAKLIAQARSGDRSAYGQIVSLYQDRLFNTVYRLLDNAEDAQDVVQDAFIHAYQSLNSFKGDSLFFTWLYRIAVNTAISWKRKRRMVFRLQLDREDGVSMEPQDVSTGHQPGHALEQAEEERRIQEALNRVSPEHRAVLILKDMEGQKYETMAEILEVPIGTIRSRLHRARLELRVVLEQMEKPKD